MITKVQLQNFKSHEDTLIEFHQGANALLGANGAGKTSVLQAVGLCVFGTGSPGAWLRKGAKSGLARVTFLAKDGNEYTIQRKVGVSSIRLLDSAGNVLSEVKDHVYRDVRALLGLDPNTDLGRLFDELVGVPQGDLTLAFRATPANRRPIFDAILRVDEYAKASEGLKDVATYGQERTAQTQSRVDILTGKLEGAQQRLEAAQRHAALVTTATQEFQAADVEATAATKAFETQRQKEQNAGKLQLKARDLVPGRDTCKQAAETAASRVKEASDAQAWLNAHQEQLAAIQADSAFLASNENAIRQAALDQAEAKTLADEVPALQKRLEDARKQADEQRSLIAKAPDYAALRAQETAVAAREESARQGVVAAQGNVAQVQVRLKQIHGNRAELAALEKEANETPAQPVGSAMRDQLAATRANVEGLVQVRAALDTQFDALSKTKTCPILDVVCPAALTELDDKRRTRHAELEESHSTLSNTLRSLEAKAKKELQVEAQQALVAAHSARLTALRLEATEAETVQAGLAALETAQAKAVEAHKLIQAERRHLVEQLAGEAGTQLLVRTLAQNQARIEADANTLSVKQARLEVLGAAQDERRDLLAKAETAKKNVAATQILQAQAVVKTAAAAELEARSSEAAIKQAAAQAAYAAWEAADLAFKQAWRPEDQKARKDAEDHNLKATAARSGKEAALKAALESHREADAAVKADEQAAVELKAAQGDHRHARDIGDTIGTVRGLIKELGPRVAARFVEQISIAADEHFRALSGGRPVRLTWQAEDYDVTVTDQDGQVRSFADLSGGEQVMAALAVRLALLKALSPVSFAIYDEPTINLDESTRMNVARVLKHSGQKQLIVVSHDDSFSASITNAVHLEKDGTKTIIRNPGVPA